MKSTFVAVIMWTLVATGIVLLTAADPAGAVTQPRVRSQPAGPVAAPSVAPDEMTLGTVRLPRRVTADGKPLGPGTYQVRLTSEEAKPNVTGATPSLERWVEFVQKGEVRGRELASIVPHAEADQVVKGGAPAPGRSKVQLLRGGYFLRVWFNKGGNHFLIHFPPTQT